MKRQLGPWFLVLISAGMPATFCFGANEHRLRVSAKPQVTIVKTPNNPSPVDVGKGIEAKLDQLLDTIRSFTLDALKAAYFQDALHGALVTALIFTILIAFTRKA